MSESELLGLNFLGGLVMLALYLALYVEVRSVATHTRRSAEANERIAAWVEWWGKRNGGE